MKYKKEGWLLIIFNQIEIGEEKEWRKRERIVINVASSFYFILSSC